MFRHIPHHFFTGLHCIFLHKLQITFWAKKKPFHLREIRLRIIKKWPSTFIFHVPLLFLPESGLLKHEQPAFNSREIVLVQQ